MTDQPKTKKARCLQDLRNRILTQDLQPGTYLDESVLAETYEISRPPLREVLNQLAGEEYVVLHKNRGAQVSPMTHKTLRNFFVADTQLFLQQSTFSSSLFFLLRNLVTCLREFHALCPVRGSQLFQFSRELVFL